MVACGVPILCSDFGGASELCSSELFKFKGGNENNFVEKLEAKQSLTGMLFRKTYLWMTFALAITGLVALYVADSPSLFAALVQERFAFLGLVLAELALVWYLSARIDRLSVTTATIMYIVYSMLNGVVLSFIFLLYTTASIATTFFVTAGTFGIMSLWGYVSKKDLTRIGSLCFMALIGLILATVVNYFIGSAFMDMVISWVGVLVFVGLTAYDTQKIKRLIQTEGYEVNDSTQKIALMGALTLYLDFINLFLYLLRLMGDRK